jgi:hypothetical protein
MRRRRFRLGDCERSRVVCGTAGPMARAGHRAVRYADRCRADRRHTKRRHADRCHADRYHADRCHADRCHADRRCTDRCCTDRRCTNHRVSEHRRGLPRATSPGTSASCSGRTYSNGCTFRAAKRPRWLARAKPANRLTLVTASIKRRAAFPTPWDIWPLV